MAQIAGTAMEPSATRSSGQTRGAAARPAGALVCPQCVAAGRAGAHGPFLVWATGPEACGFITDKPKNATQRKALQQRKCPVCQGAMRLRLPKEKGKKGALTCGNSPHCQGVYWFHGKGPLEKVRARPETGPPCPECGTPTRQRGLLRQGVGSWDHRRGFPGEVGVEETSLTRASS